MIVILGLLVLVLAAAVAVAGAASNGGSAHALGSDFTIAGLHLSGLSTGQLFLYGVVVGAIAMLGLSMLLGTFSRRMASRGSQRRLTGSRRETEALRLDRERLSHQLDDERAAHRRAADVAADLAAGVAANGVPAESRTVEAVAPVARRDAGLGERPGLLHRIGHRTAGRP